MPKQFKNKQEPEKKPHAPVRITLNIQKVHHKATQTRISAENWPLEEPLPPLAGRQAGSPEAERAKDRDGAGRFVEAGRADGSLREAGAGRLKQAGRASPVKQQEKHWCPYCRRDGIERAPFRDRYNLLRHLDSKHRKEAGTDDIMDQRRERENKLVPCGLCERQFPVKSVAKHRRENCPNRQQE